MAESVREIAPKKMSPFKKGKSIIDEIRERQTEELVIGLCGSIGSGTSTIASKIDDILVSEYNYTVEIIKISDLIYKHIGSITKELEEDKYLNEIYVSKINLDKNIEDIDAADRIALLQSAGNILRKVASSDVLTQLAIKEIAVKRDQKEQRDDKDVSISERKSWRHVTIIDSLKNPSEVELLQLVYRDLFFLFGVLCPEDIRKTRLTEQKKIDSVKATQLMERDRSEGEKHGQQLLRTIYHSEFFITNSRENVDSLKPNLERYIKIMMGNKTVTPTFKENAMFHAQSAAVKSGCLLKQVGAAIIDKKGNLLATGCNDVPKAGGGLYTIENNADDSRCMYRYGGKCKNQEKKEEIFSDIDDILRSNLDKDVLRKKLTLRLEQMIK